MINNRKESLIVTLLAALLSVSASVGAETYQMHVPIKGLKAPVPPVTFTSHTFTACGKTGRYGPTLSECESAYSGMEILKPEYNYIVILGIQSWRVPQSGTYRIKALGAQGGSINASVGGKGAFMEASFDLAQGDQLKVLVGQSGIGYINGAGGGGASYVAIGDSPLLIAAGGGGATSYSNIDGYPGRTTSDGGSTSTIDYSYGRAAPGPYGGAKGGYGGKSGYGGGAGLAGGGAGWFGNGGSTTTEAMSLSYRAFGGVYSDNQGGFGGGGGGHPSNGYGGGGGGYSGGGGGSWDGSTAGNGGGGGSFSSAPILDSAVGANSGHGSVTIEFLH